MSQNHSHHDHTAEQHLSHRVLYLKTGAVLTVLTAIEIGVLFVPQIKALWVPLMIVLAIVKFLMVVGTFMHLRDDKRLFSLLFFSPLFLAISSFAVLGALATVYFAPFGKGYAVTAVDKRAGFVEPSGGAPAEPAWAEDKLQTAFADAQKAEFAKGKEVFAKNCANCHGQQGEGMAGLGVNMTDDCYKHGGKLAELYTTVAKGVPNAVPPMPAWSGVLASQDIRDVTYYLRSLRGKNVASARGCEGTKVAD